MHSSGDLEIFVVRIYLPLMRVRVRVDNPSKPRIMMNVREHA